jgi:hypothetical protein
MWKNVLFTTIPPKPRFVSIFREEIAKMEMTAILIIKPTMIICPFVDIY